MKKILLLILSLLLIFGIPEIRRQYKKRMYQDLYPDVLMQALKDPMGARVNPDKIMKKAKEERKARNKAKKNKSKTIVEEEDPDDWWSERLVRYSELFVFGTWDDNYVVDSFIFNDRLYLVTSDSYDYRADYTIVDYDTGEVIAESEGYPHFYLTPDSKHLAYILTSVPDEDKQEKTLYIDFKEVFRKSYISDFEFINNKGDWSCRSKDDDTWNYHYLYLNGKKIVNTDAAIKQTYFNPDGKRYCYKLDDNEGPLEGFYFEQSKAFNDADTVAFSSDGKETLVEYTRDRNSYVYSRSSGKTFGPYYGVKDMIGGKTFNDWTFSYQDNRDKNHYVNHAGKIYGPYNNVLSLNMDKDMGHLYYIVSEENDSGTSTIEIYEDFNKINELPGKEYWSNRFIHSRDYRFYASLYKDEDGSKKCIISHDGEKQTVSLGKGLIRTACISPDKKFIYYYDGRENIKRINTETLEEEIFCQLDEEARKSGVHDVRAFSNGVIFYGFVCVNGVQYKGKQVNDSQAVYFTGEKKSYKVIGL